MDNAAYLAHPLGQLFGLSWTQLHPIVEAVAGTAVSSFDVTIDPRLQGLRGWNAINLVATFTYTTHAGTEGHANVFIKRFLLPGRAEAIHYAHLSRHGFPVPRVYGAVRGRDAEEILFLEHLADTRGIDDEDAATRCQLATLWARLSSVPATGGYASALSGAVGNAAVNWWVRLADGTVAHSLRRTYERALTGELGTELQTLWRESPYLLGWLVELLPALAERINCMPRSLVNPEMGIGRRFGSGEVLAFDWHGVHLGPLLSPAAHVLGTPTGVRNGWGRPWEPRGSYAAHYACELGRWCGVAISVDEVLEGTYALWQGSQLLHQGWWADRSVGGDTCVTTASDQVVEPAEAEKEATRRGCRADLHSIFAHFRLMSGQHPRLY